MLTRAFAFVLAVVAVPQFAFTAEPDVAALEKLFRDVPMEARRLTGPLFWMHGDETQQQLEGELQKSLEGHNGTFTAEPRPHKDWLGEGWYRDLGICLDFARKNNLTTFIYDDWWWPSQMMGGRVPAEYGSKRIVATAVKVDGPKKFAAADYGDKELIAVVAGKSVEGGAIDGSSLVDLTAQVKNGELAWDAPEGSWQIMKFTWQFNGTKGGQQRYISVDGASPDCVDWFIKAVYQPHYDRFKTDFGKTIVGYFYDEPETQGDWGSDVAKVIAERKLDLGKLLVAYKFRLAGEEQTAAYYSYLDCFADSWGRTMYGGMSRWCRAHGVVSMGHFMEHGEDLYNRNLSAGNMMQLEKYSDMGGIDLVCNQIYPGQRNEGIYQMPKLASSISHTYNKDNDIAFSETFGGYGQGLTYPQMKWLTDWQQVRGVNYLIPHSFNPRAPYDSDYPPYFYDGGFEPRWPLYRVWADYTNRVSTMMTGGRHVCPVAIVTPGQSFHMGEKIRCENLTSALQDALLDSDWLLYDAWENHATIEGAKIHLYKEDYRVLVLPAVEVIPYPTLVKAKQFLDAGGVVVGYGIMPSKSATLGYGAKDIASLTKEIWGDAKPGLAVCKTTAVGGRSYFLPAQPTAEEVQEAIIVDAKIHPTLELVAGDTNHYLHILHRQKSGRDVFFVCNQNYEGAAREFTLRLTGEGEPECWDPMRGQITSLPTRRVDSKTAEVELTLEPMESVMLVLSPQQRILPRRLDGVKPIGEAIAVVRKMEEEKTIEKTDPAPETPAKKFPLEGCSWVWYPDAGDPAQTAPNGQRCLRGKLAIPAGRKIRSAQFCMTVDNDFTLFINGKEIFARVGESEAWRNPATIDLKDALQAGDNCLAILAGNSGNTASPAGAIGRVTVEFDEGDPLTACIDASWKACQEKAADWTSPKFDDSAWVAAKVVAAYGNGPWGKLDGSRRPMAVSPVQADPFHGVFVLPETVDRKANRVVLELGDELLPEAAAKVTINGAYAGGVIGKPLQLDVTEQVQPGDNTILIEPFAPKTVELRVYPR